MDSWSPDVLQTLDLLAQLPRVRYAFIPGFEDHEKGNSAPGSHLVKVDGELGLVSVFNSEPVLLRDLFEGYTLEVVTDTHGFACVHGTHPHNGMREIAPLVKAFYMDDPAAQKLIREQLTRDASTPS
jgi:hypothetical protein